jgi:PadR family transcriptional regulator, regulatory protein PadR
MAKRDSLHSIMTAIKETSEQVLSVEEAGSIRAVWITNDTGRRARIYELTPAGRKQLTAEESRWAQVNSAVNRVLRMA